MVALEPWIAPMISALETTPPLVCFKDLSAEIGGRRILHDIHLEVRRGESLGIVGESGCGKSVTWLAALGLLPSRARIGGSAMVGGQQLVGASPRVLEQVRGRRVAMIFQDPSSALNPVMRIGDQIGEALRLHRGLVGAAQKAEAKRLLDLVGMPDSARRLKSYPHELSGGQNQRVMIAMALAGQPDLLVADEPTTALDATIQMQILDLLGALRRETGMGLVLISHDLGAVSSVCDRIAVMYGGRIVEEAMAHDLFTAPAHPYSQGLLAALPKMHGPRTRLRAIPGAVAEPWRSTGGCAFVTRCDRAESRCRKDAPPQHAGSADHSVMCHRPDFVDVPLPKVA